MNDPLALTSNRPKMIYRQISEQMRELILSGRLPEGTKRPSSTELAEKRPTHPATINEADLSEAQQSDPTLLKGTITVRNTALRPWTADNYDLSMEYYTRQGGIFSAGIFVKEISDFFGAGVRLATAADLEAIGLDPRYVGWNLSTKFNSGDARVSGAEFNLRHSLRALGRWGSYFTVFANATKLKLHGNQQASFTSFIPESGNWGASFSRRQLTFIARWNYRGLDKGAAVPAFGPDAFGYIKARTTLDLSCAYQLSRRLSLNLSANNVFNAPQVALRYGAQTPTYARQFNTREFGAMLSLALRGTF
jgi:iron complex outermembrane recepter protein